MSEHDGVIRRLHECHCRECERPYLGLPGDLRSAEQQLRGAGWTKVNDRWICWACAARAALAQESGE